MDEATATTTTAHRLGLRAFLAVASLAFLLVIAGERTTQAQICDPAYGCQPNPGGGGTPGASCALSVTFASAGSLVTATVSNVAVGDPVKITFNGATVAEGVAGQGQTNEFSLAPLVNGRYGATQATTTSLQLRFRVPSVSAGNYQVFAIGPAFSSVCASQGFSVVGTQVTAREGGRGLARTGIELALWLALALALLVAGWSTVRYAKRRRRKATMSRLRHAADRVGSGR